VLPAIRKVPFVLKLAVVPAILAANAHAQPLSPRNANYTITATLDARARTITGSERITWRNITRRPAADLRFHLYWNAWKHDRTTFMRELSLGRSGSAETRSERDRSRIDITSLKLVSPSTADLTGSMHVTAPDDGNPDDETVMAAPLPEPIPPGGTATIEVAWTARVPRPIARTGVIGNYFFIVQWFPKLGVLQEDGWNCHQFHAATEFFSDYGVYDVSLTVPRGWVVGATGVERGRVDNADRTTTHRYYQEDVHDFAWTASPDYVVRKARFEHPSLPAVEMRLLIQPEHLEQAERHFAATRTALKYYGEWFGAYPYGHITIVDPAYQSGAGGMEYPTLFTAGTRWLAPSRVTTPEGVTVHEAGHQFWYGVVGNDEFEDAWMDEGLNTFSTARAIAQVYDPNYLAQRYFGGFVPWVFEDIVIRRETDGNRLPGYRRDAESDAQSTPTYRYFPATAGSISYNKTALALNTMERWIGWPALQRIMSTFFERWKFKHPGPKDLFDVFSEVLGKNIDWYVEQVYRGSNTFDYGIQELKSTREGDRYRTTVVVRRFGEALFPVDILVTFKNGERVTEHWDGSERWKLYVYERASQALSAQVDPGRILLLDVNTTNNSRTLEPRGPTAATKWSVKWMVWLQDCLLSWAFFV
jgi:Peptidase family M1 domain